MSRLFLAIAMFGGACLIHAKPGRADSVYISMHLTVEEGAGASVGTVQAVDSWFTTLATLMYDLSGLPPGEHLLTLHDNADCGPAGGVPGMAAGAIYHPEGAPVWEGRKRGEFPSVTVEADGTVKNSVGLKPPQFTDATEKVTVGELRGHALIISEAGTGRRIACGVIGFGDPKR